MDMNDTVATTETEAPRGRRAGGGREAKRAARTARSAQSVPYITRKIPYFEVLDEEGLQIIERNADTILEETGIDFRDDPEALELFRKAGCDVKGERVRFPRGLARKLVQDTAPREFTQHARNPAHNVVIGGKNTVFAPAYGSPFVRDLDKGRRYATIEDFQNFVKLAYMANSLHHSGGTICEPVDLPVNKRHFDMVYAHMKYSDKPFMGSVTAPERAQDTVEMTKILFGDNWIDPLTGKPRTAVINLINANSPMTFDETMLGAAKVYARANQACIVTPFILAGAMSPVTVAGTAAQTLAEALAGMAFVQLCNPGAPVVLGSFASSISMQSGAPAVCHGCAGPPSGRAFPLGWRPVRLQDLRRASRIGSRQHLAAHLPGRCQLCAAHRRLAGRRPVHGLRKIRHGRGPGRHDAHAVERCGPERKRPGHGRHPRSRPRQALPGLCPHASQFRKRLLPLAHHRQQQLRAMGSRRFA
jgi:trimethylamine:corrinoid methyltransferase-like protein